MPQIKTGIGTITMTREELKDLYHDHKALMDCLLVLLNPEEAEYCWDIPFNHEQAKETAKDILLKNGYSLEVIKKFIK